MTDVWSARAKAFRESETHREGEDLDRLVAWADGETALDVATGGGHVARRLRDNGFQVVSCDRAPGMRPDVICRVEDLPFADSSFDTVTCRIAAHHFEDIRAAVREMARVSRSLVLVEDNLYGGERSEEGEILRDPSHVRCYSEQEWKAFFAEVGLTIEDSWIHVKRISTEEWLDRVGCRGAEAARVRELVGERIDGEDRLEIRSILLKGHKR